MPGLLGVDKGEGVQVPDAAARLRRHGSRRLCRAAARTRTAATRCSARTSQATATPTSRSRSPTASGSRSIRCRRPPIRRPPCSPTSRTSLFDSTIRYDASFFEHLDRIVQSEPWLDRDRGDDRPAQVARHREGQALRARCRDEAGARRRHPRSAGTGWRPSTTPACRRSSRARIGPSRRLPNSIQAAAEGFAEPEPLSGRRARARLHLRLYRHQAARRRPVLPDHHQGQGRRRATTAAKTYRLHVPANAPVEQYWSVTAYDRQTHALIRNVDRASRASNSRRGAEERRRLGRPLFRPEGAGGQGSELGSDRSGAQVRADVPRSMRRRRRLFDKTWTLPDVEKVN